MGWERPEFSCKEREDEKQAAFRFPADIKIHPPAGALCLYPSTYCRESGVHGIPRTRLDGNAAAVGACLPLVTIQLLLVCPVSFYSYDYQHGTILLSEADSVYRLINTNATATTIR